MNNLDKNISEEKIVRWDEQLQNLLNSLIPYLLRIWKKRKKWLMINGIGAVIIIAFMLLFAKPYYTTTIYILPDYGSNLSSLGGLSNLASLAGVSIGSSPTEIYENILQSESVLGPVIRTKYMTEKYKDSINLVDYYEIKPDDDLPLDIRERKRLLKFLERFQKNNFKTAVDKQTMILSFMVKMPESKLCADITNNIAESLDIYVRTQRKSFASNQRIYLEKRTNEVFDSLTIAEEKLRNFQERNSGSTNVPRIALDLSRLNRNVSVLQGVYMDLTRQMELIKLDEIKDAPILNIQELVGDPIIKTGPLRTIWSVILMFIYMVCVSVTFIFSSELQKIWTIMKNNLRHFR